MTSQPEEPRPPKYVENSLLVVIGVLAVGALYYQLPRWAEGLDPMFVHPSWVEQSPLPFVYSLAMVHPLAWIVALGIVTARILQNYGWSLSRG